MLRKICKIVIVAMIFMIVVLMGFSFYVYLKFQNYTAMFEGYKDMPLFKEDLSYDKTVTPAVIFHLLSYNEIAKELKEREGDRIKVVIFYYKGGRFEDFLRGQIDDYGKFDEVVAFEKPLITTEWRERVLRSMWLKGIDFSAEFYTKEELNTRMNNEIGLYRKYKPLVLVTPGASPLLSAQYSNIPSWGTFPLVLDFNLLPNFPFSIGKKIGYILTWTFFHLYGRSTEIYREIALERGFRPNFPFLFNIYFNANLAFLKNFPELTHTSLEDIYWLYQSSCKGMKEILMTGALISKFSTQKGSVSTEKLMERINETHEKGKKVLFFTFGSFGSERPEICTRVLKSLNDHITTEGSLINKEIGLIISPNMAAFRLDETFENEVSPTLSDKIIVTDFIEASKINPKVDLCLVHGGSGTLSTSMNSECPTIGVPFMFEQKNNLVHLQERGVAVLVDKKKLSDDGEEVVSAVEHVLGDYDTFKGNAKLLKEMVLDKRKAAEIVIGRINQRLDDVNSKLDL